MELKIALDYKKSIILPDFTPVHVPNNTLIATLAAEMLNLGFAPTEDLMKNLKTAPDSIIEQLHNELIPILKSYKGADVDHVPMYPNFPQEVMDMNYVEAFFNAFFHYTSEGNWKPDTNILPREFAYEEVNFKKIGIIFKNEFENIFKELIQTNESISNNDKKTIKWFIDRGQINFSGDIPFKENLCFVASILLEKGFSILPFVSNATDILRIATALSKGDISLAQSTKFISFPRKVRRLLAQALDKVINEEDINRHRNKWIRLFHNLHIGEIGTSKVKAIANKIRNGDKIETFNSKVEKAIIERDTSKICALLTQRPGEFVRRIDHVLRITDNPTEVLARFASVLHASNTRTLLQLLGNIKSRAQQNNQRVVFPKGSITKAQVIKKEIPLLDKDVLNRLFEIVVSELLTRFTKEEPLGNVYLDPALKDCPIPTQMRSASESTFQVGRGTRLPIGDKNTLRFFIYWVGSDIDLSATLHDENFKQIEQISYTNLKSSKYEAYHSGDITSAPKGASEFIDITIDKALDYGARYVMMHVYVYNGPTFEKHKKVFAGWMTRSNPNSNEIYQPETVEQKVDLTANSMINVPVIFDLKERKAISTDLSKNYRFSSPNNTHTNKAGMEDVLRAITSLDNKVTLYELFGLHVQARGQLVVDKKDADNIFSIDDGNVTPYHISVINSEFIK